jgi:RNA polymerase sigma-54 factor
MLKQGLELKQVQKLSPLQIQTIKLIELPVQELEQRVKEELESNPVLDDDPPESSDDQDQQPKDVSLNEIEERESSSGSSDDTMNTYSDDDIPSYNLHVNNYGKDERPEYNTFSVKQSFTQSLMEQLGFRNLSEHQRTVAAFIIGSLDDDGYLRRDIDSLVDDLAFRANVETTAEEVEDMLHVIQEFEPVGVGARDLRECLIIQLQSKTQTVPVQNALRILTDYFKDFSNRHFQKVISRMGITEGAMKDAMKEIQKLNPAPGGQVDDSYNDRAQQIVPDFELDYQNGQLILTMPRFSIPELRINKKYADILEDSKYSKQREMKEAATFVKQKLDSAKWFIEALKQRQNTLESTMRAILEFQHDYFIDGDERHLRPMVLKDIADRTGFDISTISRVVRSKYIETHFGIFPLKYFFSEGLENQEGIKVSTKELKNALKESVDNEDKHNPLTDDELVTMMNKLGYKVARRTIAKYRDQLDIPKARLRKEL